MNRLIGVAVVFFLALFHALGASAATQNFVTIDIVGVNTTPGGNGYLAIEETLAITCKFNLIYIQLDSEGGRAGYSTLLAAKMAGKEIQRIDYAKTHPTDPEICQASVIQVSE